MTAVLNVAFTFSFTNYSNYDDEYLLSLYFITRIHVWINTKIFIVEVGRMVSQAV